MILLYDCDCERDDKTDFVIRKNIPKQERHSIEKGIENSKENGQSLPRELERTKLKIWSTVMMGALARKYLFVIGYAKTAEGRF